MGIYAVVPVEEAFEINNVADLEIAYGFVALGACAAEVILNNKVVGSAVYGYVEVQVAVGAFCAGAVPVVQESNFLAFGINGGFYGHALEGHELDR